MSDDEFYLKTLEMEIEALRSVLSEFDGDKLEYTQMVKANALSAVRDSLIKPHL